MAERTREQFLADRRTGIGGSDIAAILGISPWSTPRDVWASKLGKIEEKAETPAMYWGNVLEDVVAKEFSKRTGYKIQKHNRIVRHEKHPFLIANIDRLVITDPKKKPSTKDGKIVTKALLECKTVSQYAKDEWGEDGTAEIPEYYKTQCHWYMLVTGADVVYLAALIGGNDFRIYVIKRNETICNYLMNKGIEFWNNYVVTSIMPPPQTFEDVENIFTNPQKKSQTFASKDLEEAIEKFRKLKEEEEANKKQQAELKIIICEFMGNNTELLNSERQKLASWSAPSVTCKTDWEAVAKDIGATEEVISKHTIETTTARRFTLAKIKE